MKVRNYLLKSQYLGGKIEKKSLSFFKIFIEIPMRKFRIIQ